MSGRSGEYTTWLPCPVRDCRDGTLEVRFRVSWGAPATRLSPREPASAEVLEVISRADCRLGRGEEYASHRYTDADVERLEAERQDEMIRAASQAEWEARAVAAERELDRRRDEGLW